MTSLKNHKKESSPFGGFRTAPRVAAAPLAALALSAALALPLTAQSAPPTADANVIVRSMENLMYPDAKSELTLVSTVGGKTETYAMTSYARDLNQLIIVRFREPAKLVGSDLLMLDRNVWLYEPKAGREMKIPSNQSFGGTGFSYGDVLRLNFSSNYDASVISQTDDSWTLELKARQRDAPYSRIELAVSKDYLPLSGKCFTRTGELIKEMVYTAVADAGAGKKPLTVTVTSPLDPEDVSTLTVVRETRRTYPPNVFNKKNLAARLEENYGE